VKVNICSYCDVVTLKALEKRHRQDAMLEKHRSRRAGGPPTLHLGASITRRFSTFLTAIEITTLEAESVVPQASRRTMIATMVTPGRYSS
jgi:hypothetical protein